MKLLTIASKVETDNILENYIDIFKKEDLIIERSVGKCGDFFLIDYNLSNKSSKKHKNIKNVFKHYMANGIADVIIDIYQENIVERLLHYNLCYFDKEEKEKIKASTLDYLKKNEYINTEGIIYKISKKSRILKSIIDFLEDNDSINIEGFINFRLKYYLDTIEDAIDKNIEDYFAEKEYREFIKILQYFVEVQEPKREVVNIIFTNNKYKLIDEKRLAINNEFLEEISEELSEIDINYDDLLISSLITIAPRKIIIHLDSGTNNFDIINIIKNIFLSKVTICEGCDLCCSDVSSHPFKGY
ncbi:sporulation protein YtxC [Proteiniborus sp. DW1]|uniref:putative sporulation protein YtxC n=1 Tax=Proteiniborus sp. DW1 TaxID=1889883 RepID=UPI00092E04FF|nr:putative sporulation protein YtxC [Proteiniborus sp. DW1]SCG82633.1 sporulation protein YtxC [Proteiniborus sp. DW1]